MTLSTNLNSNKTISNFSSLTISGNQAISGTINVSGSIIANNNLTINSSGIVRALNAYQCNTLSVSGTFINNGTISGNNQTVPGGLQTGLVVNKLPSNNSITGNAIVSSTSPSISCPKCETAYTTSGTFYVPAGVTEITVEMIGGGGRGGNRTSSGRSGGGGGGAYSSIIIPVTPGEPIGVFVGPGGNQTNPNGGNSFITRNPSLPYPSGTILYASGGSAGLDGGSVTLSGGSGGTLDPRPGRISYNGGDGAASTSSSSGGGGSAGGNNGPGNNGTNPDEGTDPSGIGGPGGAGNNSNNSNGLSPSSGFGGGGGGGRRTGTNGLGGNGANGIVIISYSCPTSDGCAVITDFGTSGSGATVIEYLCSGLWRAPEGLSDFTVSLVGGGGGGGAGDAAGGGGGGGVRTEVLNSINFNPGTGEVLGLPANSIFNIVVGDGGAGATSGQGSDGNLTSFSGTFLNYSGNQVSFNYIANGGGGGGSSFATNINGRSGVSGGSSQTGGSGGGGAVFGVLTGNGGNVSGLNSRSIGASGRTSGTTFQGGGGGGAGSTGSLGSNIGNGQSTGGNGGNGINLVNLSLVRFFGAGGGATASGASNNSPGNGGSSNIGGRGTIGGLGISGVINTGSGGGAGTTAGGRGGSGIVIISYENFRILPIELLFFDAKYQKNERSALLNWGTAKEWNNSHFEIERAVNSIDTWKKIGEKKGFGFSDSPENYHFQDEFLPLSGGNIFYRLKQVDFNGKYFYSSTKAIQVEPLSNNHKWLAYPVPSQKGIPVFIQLIDKNSYNDEPIFVTISSMIGENETFVFNSPSVLEKTLAETFQNKNAGLYIVQILFGQTKDSLKILIK